MIILMIILMILMIFYNNSEYSDCKIIFCSCFRVFVLAYFLLPFVAHVLASEVLGTLIGSLSNDDADGNENGKKAIGLFSKTTT